MLNLFNGIACHQGLDYSRNQSMALAAAKLSLSDFNQTYGGLLDAH